MPLQLPVFIGNIINYYLFNYLGYRLKFCTKDQGFAINFMI